MECRKLEITFDSANGLENVRKLFQPKVYARVSINDDPKTEMRTPVDKHGETNPLWNFTISFFIGELALQNEGVMLIIKLYCDRTLGDRYIGEVRMSIKELYECGAVGNGSLPVQKGSVNSNGELHFSWRFDERVFVNPREPSFSERITSGAMVLLRVLIGSVLMEIPFFISLA